MPSKQLISPFTSKVYLYSPLTNSFGPLTGITLPSYPTRINAGRRALSIASSPKVSSKVTP